MVSAASRQDAEFRKYLSWSLGAHLAIVGAAAISGLTMRPKLNVDMSQEALNVMWAETAIMPPKTAPDKLPGPAIPIQPEPPPTQEEPRITAPDPKVPAAKPTPIAKEEKVDRKKKLSDALASLGELPKEEKKAPRLDNFPSAGETKKTGLPASPQGGGTSLISNPTINGYKLAIQKIITEHFVWLRKEIPLYTEIAFSMNDAGEVENPKVNKSSGEPSFDQAALRAVLKSSPLPKPPAEVKEDIIKETFVIVFDTKRMKS